MIEQLLHEVSFLRVVSLLVVVWSLYGYINRMLLDRRARRLGYIAPRMPTYLPLGADFIYKGVKSMYQHKNLEFWDDMFRIYGTEASRYTVELMLAGERDIFTADPENIKAILTTQFSDYGKGEEFHYRWKDFLGDGIFTTDGEQWHNSRQLIRPMFIRERVGDLATFERHIEDFLPLLRGDGQEIDVAQLFFRFTLDTATDFLLGHSVDSLHDPNATFAEAFGEVQRIQSLISRGG